MRRQANVLVKCEYKSEWILIILLPLIVLLRSQANISPAMLKWEETKIAWGQEDQLIFSDGDSECSYFLLHFQVWLQT